MDNGESIVMCREARWEMNSRGIKAMRRRSNDRRYQRSGMDSIYILAYKTVKICSRGN